MEIYLDMFYEAKIAPLVKMEMPPDANQSERLIVIKCITRKLWNAETSEVIDLVNAQLVELKAEKAHKLKNPPELPDAQEISENLDDLPAVMGCFLEYMESVTGWSFSCLMGSPDPEQDGKICIASLTVLVNVAANAPPVPISVTDLPNSMFVPLVSPVSMDVMDPSVTLATPILSPPLDPSNATLEPPNAVPASGTAPIVASDASLMGALISMEVHVATPATNDTGPPNAEPASSAVANLTSEISYWPPVNTGDLMLSLYSHPTGHSADNFETPPLSNDFNLFGKFNFGLGFNFDAGLMPQRNDLLNPALSPLSFSGPHLSLPSLLSCSADGRRLLTSGMSTSTDASQSSPQLPPSVHPSTDVIKSLNLSIHSRSIRTIMPSTHNDQINKIGSNPDPVKAPGKENFPVGAAVPPDWIIAVHNHLMAQDLGESWKQLVAAWEHFEELLDYHCGKGLPGTKEHSEEWSQWVSKSHHIQSYTCHIGPDKIQFGDSEMVEKYSTKGLAKLSCNYASASDALPH
ncbi:hypothetical protein H0H92_015865 [Tricholoma furcatifolium]|nr:hypothetical protein H0H92_015865 [Tricholoma furcatifolium]